MENDSTGDRPAVFRPPVPGNPGGYLLLEIMIAVAVFAVGFLAIGTLVVSTSANNTKGNIVTQATLLAAETIEDLKSSVDITGLAPATYSDGHPVDAHGNPGGIFNRSWVVSDPLGFNSSRRVQVSVSWTRLGRTRTVQFDTIIRGNGI
jgi:type II secretory pathway pseudopilin PulG